MEPTLPETLVVGSGNEGGRGAKDPRAVGTKQGTALLIAALALFLTLASSAGKSAQTEGPRVPADRDRYFQRSRSGQPGGAHR